MASEESSNVTPVPQMSPADLSARAARLRAYVQTMRNPAAKSGIGTDIVMAADILDRLVELHADHAGQEAACVDAILKLIGGR